MAVERSGSCPTLTGLHGTMGPPVGGADTICSFAYRFLEKGFLRFYFLGAGFVKGGVGGELAAAWLPLGQGPPLREHLYAEWV